MIYAHVREGKYTHANTHTRTHHHAQNAKIACIDARDIGEVGAVALFEGKGKRGGKIYTPTPNTHTRTHHRHHKPANQHKT